VLLQLVCVALELYVYHYAIRQTKRDSDLIVRERMAEALLSNSGRNFWTEVKKIRSNKAGCSGVVDGCTDESSIAQVFASKYRYLYTSVVYDEADLVCCLILKPAFRGMDGCQTL
jgi:hypothetical protein